MQNKINRFIKINYWVFLIIRFLYNEKCKKDDFLTGDEILNQNSFNTDWVFHRGAGTALENMAAVKCESVSVTLPHDAMILNRRQRDLTYGNCVGYFPYETVHYTKTFYLEEVSCAYLKFEGVYMNCSIYINDCLAGQHINGYTPFLLDISPYIRIGENKLKVIVRNGVPSSRWYTGTGIYRDVFLYQGKEIHIFPDGVRLTTLQAEQDLAVIRIETDIRSITQRITDTKVRHRILNDTGDVIAQTEYPVTLLPSERKKVSTRIEIENPKFWDVDSPSLYTCVTTLQWDDQEDEQTARFGIRTLLLDTRHGLRINGTQIKLRGGCIHHDLGIVGAASFRKLEQRRIRALKAAGYNAIRCAHFPASRMLLEVCDEEGMLVMNEFSDAWTSGKTDFDYAAFFPNCWEEDAEALVNTSYNHPSVVMYSIGNEIPECANRIDVQWGKKIADKIRSLDDTRYLTNGINLPLSIIDQIPVMAAKEGMISNPTEINTLLNGGMPMIRKLMASKSVGEAVAEACSHLDIVGHNYATYRYEPEVAIYPHRVMVGSETYPGALAANWEMVEKYPQVLGDFSWTAWDYLGEAGIASILYGSETPSMYGPYPWKSAYVGDFDLIGDRRPISYWREIVWGKRTTPYIAVQDPAHFGEEQHSTQWGWTDAERCWNWQGYEGKPISVEIYSSAEEVELLCNGRSCGKAQVGTEKKHIAKMDTVYQPGVLEAVAYKKGKECGHDILRSALGALHLQAEASEEKLAKNGQDITVVSLRLVDEQGVLHPNADIPVTIRTDGPITVQGFGTADPKGEDNYFDTTITTFRGRALAVIRSAGMAGIGKVTFDSCVGQTQVCLEIQ